MSLRSVLRDLRSSFIFNSKQSASNRYARASIGRAVDSVDETLESRRLLSASAMFVSDINTATAGSDPEHFVTLGSNLYFSATDQAHGNELWKTDGTAAGTSLVADINPGPGPS